MMLTSTNRMTDTMYVVVTVFFLAFGGSRESQGALVYGSPFPIDNWHGKIFLQHPDFVHERVIETNGYGREAVSGFAGQKTKFGAYSVAARANKTNVSSRKINLGARAHFNGNGEGGAFDLTRAFAQAQWRDKVTFFTGPGPGAPGYVNLNFHVEGYLIIGPHDFDFARVHVFDPNGSPYIATLNQDGLNLAAGNPWPGIWQNSGGRFEFDGIFTHRLDLFAIDAGTKKISPEFFFTIFTDVGAPVGSASANFYNTASLTSITLPDGTPLELSGLDVMFDSDAFPEPPPGWDSLTVVPEPSAFALWSLGTVGLASVGYRRRKRGGSAKMWSEVRRVESLPVQFA